MAFFLPIFHPRVLHLQPIIARINRLMVFILFVQKTKRRLDGKCGLFFPSSGKDNECNQIGLVFTRFL
jgi:hypothetical protein